MIPATTVPGAVSDDRTAMVSPATRSRRSTIRLAADTTVPWSSVRPSGPSNSMTVSWATLSGGGVGFSLQAARSRCATDGSDGGLR